MNWTQTMFNWEEEWNISLAGCGFRSVYHLGALSCFLERVPRLVQGASKICGASSGCLVAAAVTVGIPIEKLCEDVLTTAKQARKHTLGVFHPTFSLLQVTLDRLRVRLPEDAHIRASGRLCVSLTRLDDRSNVLVSEFESREELIQVLTCSCFFPVYCGVTPPSYRGVYYMDGALSNNMPLHENRNTITVVPFSGESDICPKEGTFNIHEVHYGHVSIQVNKNNVYRIYTSFLPPKLETLAEICHDGYMDALRFLARHDLLEHKNIPASLGACKHGCRDLVAETATHDRLTCPQDEDGGLDHKLVENLPVSIKLVLCEMCKDNRDDGGQGPWFAEFHPAGIVLMLLSVCAVPLEMILVLTKSVMLWGWMMTCRLCTSATALCRDIWSKGRVRKIKHLGGESSEYICAQRTDDEGQSLTSNVTSKTNRELHHPFAHVYVPSTLPSQQHRGK